mgnify:CR=1 FL=1
MPEGATATGYRGVDTGAGEVKRQGDSQTCYCDLPSLGQDHALAYLCQGQQEQLTTISLHQGQSNKRTIKNKTVKVNTLKRSELGS